MVNNLSNSKLSQNLCLEKSLFDHRGHNYENYHLFAAHNKINVKFKNNLDDLTMNHKKNPTNVCQWMQADNDFVSPKSNANKLSCNEKNNSLNKCSIVKSVQILTPTKSERILFDPNTLVMDSLFLSQELNENEPKIDIVNERTKKTFFDYEINSCSSIKTMKKLSLKTNVSNVEEKHCTCSPKQIKPFTLEICLSCRRPLNVKPKLTTVNNNAGNGMKTINSDSMHHPSSHPAPKNNCDNDEECTTIITNNNHKLAFDNSTLPLIANNTSCNHNPQYLAHNADSRYFQLNELNHSSYFTRPNIPLNQISLDKIYDCNDSDFDENLDNSLLMEDKPRFCRKCNLWYDSFDPSYPFHCNCISNKSNTINTNDSGSIYSVHMQKDFRLVGQLVLVFHSLYHFG